jgi:hypothetical protein
MLMELLAPDDQGVADLPPDDQEDDLLALDIIQDAEVARPQLKSATGSGRSRLIALVGVVGRSRSRARMAASRGPPFAGHPRWAIPEEIERETAVVRARYDDPTPRMFPVAATMLMPERLGPSGTLMQGDGHGEGRIPAQPPHGREVSLAKGPG